MPVDGLSFSVLMAFFGLAQSCSTSCENKILQREASPNGSYAAALFERNCGVGSGNNFQFSIFRSDAPLTGTGNTFVIDYPEEYYYQNHPLPMARVRWTSEASVTIEYSKGARIFTQATMVQGVKVHYVIK